MTHRIERINHLIQEEISTLLQREVKDPRLGSFVSVTAVITSPDMKYARVYVSHLGSDIEKKETMAALNKASGFMRSELARNLRLRRVPELSFNWDETIEHGAHIEELIDKVTRLDKEKPKAE